MTMSKEEFRRSACKQIKFRRAPNSSQDPSNAVRQMISYEWKDYCPEVFRRIRELRNIEDTSYMLSICTEEILSNASSPGRNSRVVPLSDDSRFVLRFLNKSQVKEILNLLPSYYLHLEKNQATVLTILYGLHQAKQAGGSKVYFAVHASVIPANANTYRIYDLKGSSKGRKPSKRIFDEKILLKDQDFNFRFYLDPLIRERLLAQIKYDCELLEIRGMMDYSFLIGICARGSCKGSITRVFTCKKTVSPVNSIDRRISSSSYAFEESNSPRISIESESTVFKRISTSTLQDLDEIELTFGDNLRAHNSSIKFGTGMPARALRIDKENSTSNQIGSEEDGYDVVLYFAIVDIFKNYNVVKRIQKCYKSVKYDSKSISAVNPQLYSTRFQNFLKEIFQAEDSGF